jgi:hypothetical protein
MQLTLFPLLVFAHEAAGGASKKSKKVYIPVDKYPDINFMGAFLAAVFLRGRRVTN